MNNRGREGGREREREEGREGQKKTRDCLGSDERMHRLANKGKLEDKGERGWLLRGKVRKEEEERQTNGQQ